MTVAYVCLGRYGDICNTLPMAFEDSRIGGPVSWIVAKEFASVLEGCSYVRPVIWPGKYWDMLGAVNLFKDRYDLRIVQPWSSNYPTVRIGDSFCRSAWAQIGRRGWPGRLVFDRRDPDRECSLALSMKLDIRRCELEAPILVALDSTSSPFAHRADVLADLCGRFGDRVVILEPKANRLFDLCGLFERAACLVTVDTAHLHLSWAVPTCPVVALIADHPSRWHGTARRPNQVFRVRYGDYTSGRNALIQAVGDTLNRVPASALIHTYSEYVRPVDARVRHERARTTWEAEYGTGEWKERPFTGAGRKFGSRELPMVAAILDQAAEGASDRDLIVLTNDDTCFTPGLTATLLELANLPAAAGFAHRMDVGGEERVLDGRVYPGVDLVAMSVRVWRSARQAFPACVIGAEQWDLAMLALMRQLGAIELAGSIWHVPHMPGWIGPNAQLANQHNRRVCGKWFGQMGITADQVIDNVV